jgi:hypothetical protein
LDSSFPAYIGIKRTAAVMWITAAIASRTEKVVKRAFCLALGFKSQAKHREENHNLLGMANLPKFAITRFV